ncbi:UNVERIFIED_CONTAM: hypothetical protein NCL1_54061 [Trichonephila clavipes]
MYWTKAKVVFTEVNGIASSYSVKPIRPTRIR